MGAFVDLTGQRFGKLTAIKVIGKKHTSMLWLCACDCGNEKNITSNVLRQGLVASCGCAQYDHLKKNSISLKHGATRNRTMTRLYRVWLGMRERCNYPKNIHYSNYGGRGIAVCDEWNDYSVFCKWALENGYDENAPRGVCTLDRIDSNGNYEPSNCRFVSMKEQNNNRRPRRKKNGF